MRGTPPHIKFNNAAFNDLVRIYSKYCKQHVGLRYLPYKKAYKDFVPGMHMCLWVKSCQKFDRICSKFYLADITQRCYPWTWVAWNAIMDSY